MADQPRGNCLSDQSRQVRRHDVHLLHEVPPEALPVFCELDHPLGKVADVDQVDLGDVTPHTSPRRVEHVPRPGLVVVEHLLDLGEGRFLQRRPVADEHGERGVLVCVRNDLVQFGEVPAVPFSDTHREGVEVLVELVGERDRLDDHVVGTVDVELGGRKCQ